MGRKAALVIGNSEYDDASLARLITPSEDANDLAMNASGSVQASLTNNAVNDFIRGWSP